MLQQYVAASFRGYRGQGFSAAVTSAHGGVSRDLSIRVQPTPLNQLRYTMVSSKGVQSTQLFQPQHMVASRWDAAMRVQPSQLCKHSIPLLHCHVTPITYLCFVYILVFWGVTNVTTLSHYIYHVFISVVFVVKEEAVGRPNSAGSPSVSVDRACLVQASTLVMMHFVGH